MKIKKITLAVLPAIAFVSLIADESESNFSSRVAKVRRDWKTISADTLCAPENADVVQELKRIARTSDSSDVVVPLLRFGDRDVIKRCLTRFRRGTERGEAAQQLKLSNNPAIIADVAGDLQRNESTDRTLVGSDLLLRPISLYACDIIREILLNSSSFNENVKNWARALEREYRSRKDEARQEMRRWWMENQQLLEHANYIKVTPPANSRFLTSAP